MLKTKFQRKLILKLSERYSVATIEKTFLKAGLLLVSDRTGNPCY